MIRLLIADDHPLVRNALTQLLGAVEDIEVVATTVNGREAVTMAVETSPDVVLMDLEMPELNGIEATRELIAADPSARVVILTTFSDRENIMGALDAGALGYLLKDAEPEEIIRGVRSAARGDSPLAPRAARRLEISEKTVKAHLTSVFAQIGVSDRTQAALWAHRHNITR
jgi:DNA-binding NarL/FixJ family response regulator